MCQKHTTQGENMKKSTKAIQTYSISGVLPVNVIIKADSKRNAIKTFYKLTDVPYESAGDIVLTDPISIIKL